MAVKLSKSAINHIYSSRAAALLDDAKLAISDTQVRIGRHGKISWQLEAEEAMSLDLSIVYSAASPISADICVGDAHYKIALPAAKGYFSETSNNFSRLDTGIELSFDIGITALTISFEGACAVSSIELASSMAVDASAENRNLAAQARASIAPYANGYGFMFHWVGQSMPHSGAPLPYAQAVEAFDAEAFADMVEAAGGRYVFFTTNHMYPHFPAPIVAWEQHFPHMTTRRDLIADIGKALAKRGIAMMLYINFTSALYPDDVVCGDVSSLKDFACSVFEEVGNRYGKLLKGWWVDSCYQLERAFVNMDIEPLWRASKTGNAERIVAFNYWILPVSTPFMDFWAGEVCSPIALPKGDNYDYGCAVGLPVHSLLLMEDNWWHDKADSSIVSPRFNAQQLAEYIHEMNAHGGMVTINLQIYQDGGIGMKTMNELNKLKNLIY